MTNEKQTAINICAAVGREHGVNHERMRRVRPGPPRADSRLPRARRDALRRLVRAGVSNGVIAEVLGMTPGTARVLVHQAGGRS